MLVVTGFQRGRFPTPTSRDLLLGPLERAWLAGASADLAALPDEADLADDARRETLRALALASERVLLVAPRRTADGSEVDVALAWRDLLAMLPDAQRRARDRFEGAVSLRAWIDRDLGGPRATARARRAQSLRARAEGDRHRRAPSRSRRPSRSPSRRATSSPR